MQNDFIIEQKKLEVAMMIKDIDVEKDLKIASDGNQVTLITDANTKEKNQIELFNAQTSRKTAEKEEKQMHNSTSVKAEIGAGMKAGMDGLSKKIDEATAEITKKEVKETVYNPDTGLVTTTNEGGEKSLAKVIKSDDGTIKIEDK